MANPAPLISLEKNAKAPVLRYDIPEPTSYSGFNLIRLEFDDDGGIFTQSVVDAAKNPEPDSLRSETSESLKKRLNTYFTRGLGGRELGLQGGSGITLAEPDDRPNPLPLPDPDDDPKYPFGELDLDDVVGKVKNGERIIVDDNVNGDTNVTTVPSPEKIEPRLYLIETIRLTSFLGDYGAGRVVKTFSLLPGESTKISVKTYRQTESTSKKGSSILDSVTTEAADDFQDSLQSEQSDQRGYETSREYYADVTAKASWGWGSASVKAGIKGSSNATRQEAVKNISTATQSHSSKASAKREVQIDTSFEVTQKEGQETSIEREIENINVSRTLNFVFRQMNQAFVSFIHLTDVRVGFFNGLRESRIEVPLSDIDSLLKKVVKATKSAQVKTAILAQLDSVRSHDGTPVNVVKRTNIAAGDEYLSFDNAMVSQSTDASTNVTYDVPGVILGVNNYVMRTEGVIVESILGEGEALDEYAKKLQENEVERRSAETRAINARADREELVNKIVTDEESTKADIMEKLVCPCGEKDAEKEDSGGGSP